MNTDHVIPEAESDVPYLSPEELARLREQAVTESASLTSYWKEVERHLWIAFELAPNLADIPENLAIFIAHLTEAEQLSRSCEKLYLLIKENRLRYEQDDVVPDWELLAKTLYEKADRS